MVYSFFCQRIIWTCREYIFRFFSAHLFSQVVNENKGVVQYIQWTLPVQDTSYGWLGIQLLIYSEKLVAYWHADEHVLQR